MERDDAFRESMIPPGWRFYSADFSLMPDGPGRVLLMRDKDELSWWYGLPWEQQQVVPLYVSGRGATIREAVVDAVAEIIMEREVIGESPAPADDN